MADEPVNFREALANRDNDATKWTVLDCLKALVRDLESGECQPVDVVYVAMMRRGPDGGAASFPWYTAGGKAIELRGLLAQHQHDVCSRARS